jgi:hypothetical protein
MANPNKARGTRWESATAQYLRTESAGAVQAHRPAQVGRQDVGDVHVDADWILQCKDHQKWSKASLLGWLEAAGRQALAAGRPWAAVVVKRRRGEGCSGAVGEGLVLMRLETFAELLSENADLKMEIDRLRELRLDD